jgi:imidazole glycerol-phosphate synthase subunit HisH
VIDVAIVDYGAGNTRSVRAALTRLGAHSIVTCDTGALLANDVVILPGVGSARSAMEHLTKNGSAAALCERHRRGGFTLGICLGLQLSLESTEEDGGVSGLGLITGHVHRLHGSRVPRIGWARVDPWRTPYYFAHCYAADTSYSVATSEGICAVVQHASFLGVQFHPEKSGTAGLDFLEQCLSRA